MVNTGSFKYNPNIDCDYQKCGKCGWNPEIEEKRKLKNKKLGKIKKKKWVIGEKKEYRDWKNETFKE